MGDDIGLGSVTGCLLRSFSDFKRQTELHCVAWVKNNNKRNPNRCHHPLITQLIFYALRPLILFLIKKKLCVDVAHTRLLFHTCDRALIGGFCHRSQYTLTVALVSFTSSYQVQHRCIRHWETIHNWGTFCGLYQLWRPLLLFLIK